MIEIGTLFVGRYEVLAKIGEGGMGMVYKVRDTELNSVCALKFLSTDLLGDKESRARFLRECKAMSRIAHKNVARIFRIGFDGAPYLVMEYLEGDSLRKILQAREKLPCAVALEIVALVCEGMAAAHEKNVVHRDLKPDNIVLVPIEEGDKFSVKVLDFGLARFNAGGAEQSQHLTQSGMLIGSTHYMSPEQCRGQRIDERADIYSLGCVLFECLTGRPPFEADSPIGLVFKHQNEEIPTVAEGNESARSTLNAVVRKSLAKLPSQRYQSVLEFRDDLFDVLKGEMPRCASREMGTGKSGSKTPILLTLLCVSIVLGLLICAVVAKRNSPAISYKETRSEPSEEARETELARTVNHFRKLSDKYQSGEAEILLRKLTALRGIYWKRGMTEKWYKSTPLMIEAYTCMVDGVSRQVKLHAANYDRCYELRRSAVDESVRKLWASREQESISQIERLAKSSENPRCIMEENMAHCRQFLRQGQLAQAYVRYQAAFALLQREARTISEEFFTRASNEEQFDMVNDWLRNLTEYQYCKNSDDALILAEMIVPLANLIDSDDHHETAVAARAFARRTLSLYLSVPPAAPAMRARYESIILSAKEDPDRKKEVRSVVPF